MNELIKVGYNFPSLEAISNYLEPTCGGTTAWWAFRTAQKYGLVVSIGYPEITTDPHVIPKNPQFNESSTLDEVTATAKDYVLRLKASRDPNTIYWTFNSSLTIGPSGEILAHYRKTHLYYSDATWASPSIDGFQTVPISFSTQPSSIATSFAICMDLNPKAFTAEWTAYELASQMLSSKASLLVVSTAWLTKDAAEDTSTWPCCSAETAESPEMDTITFWIERLAPLVSSSNNSTVVIANRVGNEKGDVRSYDLDNLVRPMFQAEMKSATVPQVNNEEGIGNRHTSSDLQSTGAGGVSGVANVIPSIVSPAAHYAGSSLVLTAGNGVVRIHGILGKGVESVLVADTNEEAVMKFRLKDMEE